MANLNKRKWIRCGTTHILMELRTDNMEPEWHIVGYILPRKVYESLPSRWYAFKSTNEMIGAFEEPHAPDKARQALLNATA